jgi:hypothetical protein
MTDVLPAPKLVDMRVAGPPSRERLTAMALRILEEALALADYGPVKRTLGHRLALAWLAHEGIGLPWHYEAFWKAMGDPYVWANPHYNLRSRDLTGLLDHWYRQIGWEAPCCVQRANWKRERSVSGTNRQPQDEAGRVLEGRAATPDDATAATFTYTKI